MGRQIIAAGKVFDLDDLPLTDLEELGGLSQPKMIAALLEKAGVDPNTVRWAEVAAAETDTMPSAYNDGIPSAGGRLMDGYVVAFAQRFSWPPSTTRAQSLRDLQLLAEALGE